MVVYTILKNKYFTLIHYCVNMRLFILFGYFGSLYYSTDSGSSL